MIFTHLLKLLKRYFVYFICINLTLSSFPSWAVVGIQPSNKDTVVQIGSNNKTQNVYIAKPKNGLSHNFYNNFNVDKNGAAFINFNDGKNTYRRSKLGGSALSNSNLNVGQSAKIILNEVISPKMSDLSGFMEVVGNKSEVIIANPYGITCNGCGFINTSRALLTTGKPILNNGNLDFNVIGGNVNIQRNGLNANTVDVLDIVAKGVNIDGIINARDMFISGGKGRFSYLKRSLVSKDKSEKEKTYSIDATVFGAMYANRIHIIANGKNVGVKVDSDMATSADDIVFTADGDIELSGNISSKKDIKILSKQSINIKNSKSEKLDNYLYTQNNLTVNAENNIEISINSMGAGNNISLNANNISDVNEGLDNVRFANNINIDAVFKPFRSLITLLV